MNVKDIMTQDVEVVSPDLSLKECSIRMKDMDVGAIPVCDNDRLVGMITDRDIVLRAIAEDKDPSSMKVRDAMSKPIHYCFEDQDVSEVARTMQEKQVRRLCILNRDKRLVGIVSLGDLAVESKDRQLTGETVQRVSEPGKKVA